MSINTYKRYCPNVFVALCADKQEKGDEIIVTTKRGKENECIVFNFLGEIDGKYAYSIVRADGFDYRAYCERKAERFANYASSAQSKSDGYYEASQEGKDFLVLAEPIKIGHHSEKRHRALIERNHKRMDKCVELGKKASAHASKSDYWSKKANDINLSMPESLEYYADELIKAKEYHQGLKDGKYKKEHSYSASYARKKVKDLQKKYKTAEKLWGEIGVEA